MFLRDDPQTCYTKVFLVVNPRYSIGDWCTAAARLRCRWRSAGGSCAQAAAAKATRAGHFLSLEMWRIWIVDVFSILKKNGGQSCCNLASRDDHGNLLRGSATLRAPNLSVPCSAMESLDVKELVIYAEVRGRPGILFQFMGGFFMIFWWLDMWEGEPVENWSLQCWKPLISHILQWLLKVGCQIAGKVDSPGRVRWSDSDWRERIFHGQGAARRTQGHWGCFVLPRLGPSELLGLLGIADRWRDCFVAQNVRIGLERYIGSLFLFFEQVIVLELCVSLSCSNLGPGAIERIGSIAMGSDTHFRPLLVVWPWWHCLGAVSAWSSWLQCSDILPWTICSRAWLWWGFCGMGR